MSQFIEMFKGKTPNSKLRDWVDTNIVKVKRAFKEDDTIEYIDISSVNNTSNEIASTTTYLLKNAPSRAQQCVRKGDILLSTVRPNLKNIGVNHSDKENLVASTGFCILRPKKGLSQLIIATIMSDDFTNKMTFVAKGTNYPAFHDYDALDYPVYSPNVEELNKVTSLYKQADKSKFIGFKSQFIEMFGGCLNKVEITSLCDVFIDGDWIESRDQSDIGIRLIQTGNVGNGFFKDKDDKSRFINKETFTRLNCTEIMAGDVLVSRLPEPIGRACIIPDSIGKAITAVDCTIMRFKDTLLPEFFIAYTQTPDYQLQINKVSTGTTRRRVSRMNLGKIRIICPSIDEQKQFVEIAQQADKSKYIN